MIRHATIFWVAIAGLFLTALTIVGSEVKERHLELRELNAAIAREHETIHVLKAERAYLASPERVATLAETALGLVEFDAGRIIRIADLPRHHRTPELELAPDRTQPLLLSSAIPSEADRSDGFAPAAFLPSARPESAGLLHETAVMTVGWGPANE